ncbi:MAG TPA: DUF4328 domain-containing protein [Acidimicrobiales bacterium]|nr:DUF4328 domain-containing protein [Acidimicrobiales bacterium]
MSVPLAHPLAALARALRVLLLVCAVLSALLALLAVRMRIELDQVDRTDRLAGNAANEAVDAFFGGLSVFFVTLVGIGALFVTWMYRAARNNQAFDRPGALGPGWAVGAWFIPFGSLVIPGIQLQQLWRGADGTVPRGDVGWRRARSSVQIWCWWAAYVVGQTGVFTGFTLISRTDQPDAELTATALLDHLDDVRTGVVVFVAGQAVLVVAAALGAASIVALTRRQEAAAGVLGSKVPLPEAVARTAPAAWLPDPLGRFDLRWWDGSLWTEHVSRAGEVAVDPLDD